MAIPLLRTRRRQSPDGTMTLVEHLAELRQRLLIALVAVLGGAVVAFVAYNHILAFLTHPYCTATAGGASCNLYVTGPLDGFAARVKVAGYGGLFLASPVVLWQLWRFITPGLRPGEKRYAIPFIVSSVVLFCGGVAVAYLVFPHALHFLAAVGGPTLKEIYSPNSYLSLVLLLMVCFGMAFELPVLLVSLELAGVVTSARLAAWRRPAIVVIFLLAAIFIPSSDPFSLLALAIPLCLLYEAAILIGKIARR